MKNFNLKKKSKAFVAFFLVLSMTLMSGCGLFDDEEETSGSTRQDSESYVSTSDSSDSTSSGSTLTSSDAGVATTLFDSSLVRDHKVQLKGNGEDTVTVLMYMNGSNLESDDGEASTDLSEIVKAGSSDKVNFLVQTMGTKSWSNYGIASDRSQIYSVDGNGLTLVKDDLGQLDCTVSSSLESFIKWGVANYPADRYILLFWDHGGGPVYGFGYDEWNDDEYAALTIDEMQTALANSGVFFDFIGMDCCIMACLEVCAALYDYCDYCVLSEDFESGLGWSYTDWMSKLYANTSISTVELGTAICDSMVSANENDSDGDDSILALIDESMMKVLWTAWSEFAYENEDSLLNNNYSRSVQRSADGRVLPIITEKTRENIKTAAARYSDYSDDYYSDDYYSDDYYSDSESDDATLSEYYITDIMALASTLSTDASAALESAVNNALVHVATTSGDSYLTGISVTLPYGDSDFYSDLQTIFTNCGFDSTYVSWLESFVSASGSDDYYDYDDWDDDWDGWDDYDDDYDWDSWDWSDEDDYWDDWDDNDWGGGFDDFWDGWDDFSDDDYYDDYGDDGYYDDFGDDGYYDDFGDDGYYDDYGDGGYYDDYGDDGYYDDYGNGGYYDDFGNGGY